MELKIEIFGRVQGVGFRNFVSSYGKKLGLNGIVFNSGYSSVISIAQGSKDKLNKFLDYVRKGTFLSNIEGVSYSWRNESEKFEGFKIIREGNFLADQKSSFTNLGKNIISSVSTPKHVAIIPDGNRRWAKSKGLAKIEGYRKVANTKKFIELIKESKKLGIDYLTLWLFSTDNWKRESKEVDILFNILKSFLKKISKDFVYSKTCFRHIGRRDRIPKNLLEVIEELEDKTKDFKDFNLQVCVDYGGRDEIIRAVNKAVKSGISQFNEEVFKKYLDFSEIPDPDLIIRTSGEYRIGGFMAFQGVYSELYFTDSYFPDFGILDLKKAVEDYSKRKRRFGG